MSCDPVLGVQIPTNADPSGLTSFVNESCDGVSVRGKFYRRDPAQQSDDLEQDLLAYLARPWIVASFPFSSTSRVAFYGLQVGRSFFASTLPLTNGRITGCAGWRATLVFRLQIASNPFLAGRIRMVWYPQYSDAVVWDPTTTANGVSMLPGVELDLAEQTSVEMRVPWVHATNYWPWTTYELGTLKNLGKLVCFAYLPLTVASGTTAPNCTLYFSMEDVELVAAAPPVYIVAEPQAGGLPPADSEASGPIAKSLYHASKSVSFLSRGVPSISSVLGPTSWALSRLSGLASAFGWSKPLNMTPVTRMTITARTFENNCDGIDTTWNLGMSMNNHIAPATFAGTDVDEMAFDHILQQYALIGNATLSTSDVALTLKYASQISPSAMFYFGGNGNWVIGLTPVPPANYSSVLTTPAFYVGNVFRQWAGGFRFRVKVAKTKFHTGRLLLQFAPVDGDNSTPGGTIAGPVGGPYNVFSKVWDLREGNEMEFDVPFVSQYQYLPFLYSTGTFSIGIIEPLAGPSTVSQVVPFAVEVKCLPGFEFAIPNGPLLYNSPQVPFALLAQSGVSGDSTYDRSGDQHCIGERVTSVKQMISRTCLLFSTTSGAALLGNPWYNYPFTTYTGSPPSVSYPTAPYCKYFSRCYAYARGSTIFDFYDVNSGGPANSSAVLNRYYLGLDQSQFDCAGPVMDRTNALHVTMPFYARTTKVLTNATDISMNPFNQASLNTDTSTDNFCAYFIRAGDDAQLGYFLGTPPLDLPLTSFAPSPSSVLLSNYLQGI